MEAAQDARFVDKGALGLGVDRLGDGQALEHDAPLKPGLTEQERLEDLGHSSLLQGTLDAVAAHGASAEADALGHLDQVGPIHLRLAGRVRHVVVAALEELREVDELGVWR